MADSAQALEEPIRPARPSPRAQLAELALDAALEAEGAVAGHPGPLGVYMTPGPAGALTGVVAVADPGGRFDVLLHLIADPVPLHALADRVRALVAERAESAGLTDTLGSVQVFIEDVVTRPPPEPPAGEA